MLSIDSDATLERSEWLIQRARLQPGDGHELQLATSIPMANRPFGAASLAQAIITWTRSYPNATLIPYVLDPLDATAASNFANTTHGFVATMMADSVVSRRHSESIKPLLYSLCASRAKQMNSGRIGETGKGLSSTLICVDHSTLAYLSPFYHGPEAEPRLKGETDFVALMSDLLTACVPTQRRGDFSKSDEAALGAMFRELFANTHEHARQDASHRPWKRSVRGVTARYHRIDPSDVLTAANGMERLASYFESHREGWPSKNRDMTFLELCVFDSGPGLASRMLGVPPDKISLAEEEVAVVKCFQKHVTSKGNPTSGIGLYRTTSLLKERQGFFWMRTGRCSLQTGYGPSTEAELLPMPARTTGEPTTLRPASGTVVSLLIPVGKLTR